MSMTSEVRENARPHGHCRGDDPDRPAAVRQGEERLGAECRGRVQEFVDVLDELIVQVGFEQ
jgi:hypothetical protein